MAPEFRFESAAALHAALGGSEQRVALSALQAIMRDPVGCYRLGTVDGLDLVDRLIDLLPRDEDLRPHVVTALACFGDPRVFDVLVDEIATCSHEALIIGLSNRLSVEKLTLPQRNRLRPLLRRSAADAADPVLPARCIAAARLLVSDPDLTDEDRVRVSVVLPDAPPPPPMTRGVLPLWVDLLRGPFATSARRVLGEHADQTDLLWTAWEHLDAESQRWLVQVAVAQRPLVAREALAAVIAPGLTRSVLREALRGALALQPLRVPALEACLRLDDPEVQVACLLLGAADADIDAWLAPSRASSVRIAALRRLAATRGAGGRPRLLEALHDDDWAMRASAVELLTASGEVDELPVLLSSPHERVRIAASQLAMRLGRDDLLEALVAAGL